ncbi:single-stranded-DNA-specific exonuclease RecJ [Paenibacillus assamensis]|uniref:single-stranded-DNA-specific exonuclease RecJ n=1 Tax=Paenibacillus assamensis TaxID=311244 RepID=UPI00042389D5|nr:single-stranded-DNA-specific exonuclease RecJ [Paenibacillus assamensis]
MLQSRTRWRCAEVSEQRAEQLAVEAGISPLLAKLLIVRGIEDGDGIHSFLYDNLEAVHDPYLLAGMKEAVERIHRAVEQKEHIRIYGDYDADGVSSTSLMVFVMRELGAHFDYYIPHRANEGYGLNNAALDLAKNQGVSLIVTVDTGVSAVDQIAYAKQLGIDVVVTDHHEPPALLPEAYALVNPKLPTCPYPFKGLAGVGVAFKLAHALLGKAPEHLLEIAAIGTVADLMPLVGENRIIVREALQRMKRTIYPGIQALLDIGGVDRNQLVATNIAFSMAPRINASGRLAHADLAVKLLIADDLAEAKVLAEELDSLNKERQKIVDVTVKEAEKQMAAKIEANGGEVPSVIVLANEEWNVGVIGIVASKLVDRYYRPTFILGIDSEKGLCKGSARSIDGFDLYGAMTDCADLFEHYGGHHAAAGMTIAINKLPELEQKMQVIAQSQLTPEHFVPCTDVDAVCTLKDVPLQVIDELGRLEPFGMGNPQPRIVIRDASIQDKRTMGKEGQHLKLMLSQDRATLDAVAFQRGELSDIISPLAQVDVLGELSINEWNGSRRPQLMLKDIRINHVQLIDLRGTKEPVVAAVELARKLESLGRGPVAWLTTPEEATVYAGETFVRWTSMVNGQPNQEDKAIRDLVISSIPDDQSVWEQWAQRFSHVERIHVILNRQPFEKGIRPPARERIIPAFAACKQLGSWLNDEGTRISLAHKSGLSPREWEYLMNVFAELGFVTFSEHATGGTYEIVEKPQKTSLESSEHYKRWDTISRWESLWNEAASEQLAERLLSLWGSNKSQQVSTA